MHNQSLNMAKFVRTCLQVCEEVYQQQQQQHHRQLLASVQTYRRWQQNQQQKHHHHLSTVATCAITARSNTLTTAVKFPTYPQQNSHLAYSKFTAAREPPNLGSIPLCEERAQDLISNLKDSERAAIKTALAKYEALKLKEGFEGKLAATQWRTRFGRPSSVHSTMLGEVDPTGSYCAFPDDWLKKKAVEKAKEPTRSDLTKIFFVNAVPFVGFGFLDNFTMIIAGDYIEQLFGTFMCISTMAAAGLGNTISDILGIGSAFYVERGCEMMGLKPPDLTPVQLELKSSRRTANYGRMIGITVGCLVGMLPLLFMDKKPTEEKEAKESPACERKKAEDKKEATK